MLMAEFATAVKYQLPIKVIVIKNNTLGQIKWEQMVFLGNPEYGCELHPIDFAMFARACGGSGFTTGKASECSAVLDTALTTPGPGFNSSRGGCQRTAVAGENHHAAGGKVCRIIDPGNAAPKRHRADSAER